MYVLAPGGVGGVRGWKVRGLGLGFTNPGGTWGRSDMCVFWLLCCGWCGGVDYRLGPGRVLW